MVSPASFITFGSRRRFGGGRPASGVKGGAAGDDGWTRSGQGSVAGTSSGMAGGVCFYSVEKRE